MAENKRQKLIAGILRFLVWGAAAVTVGILALLVSVPVGVFSDIYLVEYARRGNKLVGVVCMTTETLSGIPSIVYGLFGYLMFGVALGWGYM